MHDRLRSVRLPSRKRYKARRLAQIDHGNSGLLAEPGDLDGFTAIMAQVADGACSLLRHMHNCEDRLPADPAGLGDRMACLAGIDAHRVRRWLFARSVQESIGSPLMGQAATRLAPAQPSARSGSPSRHL